MSKIRFTVQRDAWTEYEADKPEGFDNMTQDEQWEALLDLSYDAKEIAGETMHLNIYLDENQVPL